MRCCDYRVVPFADVMRIVTTKGFTLLELMVTFFISLILLMLIVPSQHAIVLKSSLDVMRLQLLRAIQLARQEAITQETVVTLCQSSNQTTCLGQWNNGYIILANNKVIHAFVNAENQGKLYWRAFPANQAQLDFLPSGFLKAENGTFWYCLPHAKNPSWAIVLNQSGRAREVLPEQEENILKDGERKISC